MDDLEVFRILSDAERSGFALAAFYHSHIDCEAYFSQEDRTAALFGEHPAYPGALYLVLSVCAGQVGGHKAFAWNPSNREFEQVPVSIHP